MTSGPVQISGTVAQRLVQSTGNLYWSCNPPVILTPEAPQPQVTQPRLDVTGPTIFRASKSNQPGEERSIYTEQTTGEFCALTYAEVDGDFYGYFVANYEDTSEIKRIPLAGVPAADGPVPAFATSPGQIGAGDLVTDGEFLCWADSEGIWSMPIGGGTLTQLIQGAGFAQAHLAVLDGALYYIDDDAIYSIPMAGGAPNFVLGSQTSPITALYALYEPLPAGLADQRETPGPAIVSEEIAVVWGRADGAVLGLVRGETTTYQGPTADTTVVCVYSTGTRVLWSNEILGPDGPRYEVRMYYAGVPTTLSNGFAYLSDRDLMADEAAAYWTLAYIEKYTF